MRVIIIFFIFFLTFPGISAQRDVGNNQCSDGTPYRFCGPNKPDYCNRGTLEDNCIACGCPYGEICSPKGICEQTTWESINTGERNILVLMVRYADSERVVDDSCNLYSSETVRQKLFDDDDQDSYNYWIREVSNERSWWSGDVFEWYSSSIHSNEKFSGISPPYSNIITEFSEQADSLIDFTQYEMIFLITSKDEQYASGESLILETDEGTFSFPYFVKGGMCNLKPAALHEFGHKLGFGHAKALDCGDVPIRDNCETIEYGDPFDIQGGNRQEIPGPFNVIFREHSGWISDEKIIDVSTSGTYQISTISMDSESPQAIKISLPEIHYQTQSYNYFNLSYYVEFRQPIGLDSWVMNIYGEDTDIFDGALIRLGGGQRKGPFNDLIDNPDTLLVYASPGTGNMKFKNFGANAILKEGSTFVDEKYGLKITTLRVDETSLEVAIDIDSANAISKPEIGKKVQSNVEEEDGFWTRLLSFLKELF